MKISEIEYELYKQAYAEAQKSLNEGGLPIGAVITDGQKVLAKGHNLRVQTGDPTAHGEMVCIRNFGRQLDYSNLTLISTLSPCMMCSGTILQFGIRRVIVGEDKNFKGNIELLRSSGVDVVCIEDQKSIELMNNFIVNNFKLWREDIAESDNI